MTRKRVDALVIGAGAAGLAAARELSYAGLSVTVVEARSRIGGRVFTVHDRSSPVPIELGAEFVHGEAEETFKVIRAAALIVDELPDEHYWSRDGKLVTIPDFWGKVDEVRRDIARRLRSRKTADFSFHDYLERAKLPAELRQMLINFVEGYHAAHVEKISARSLAAGDEETQGESENKQFRIVSGSDALIFWLRGGLDPEKTSVHLNTIATRLRWKRGEVTLECRSGIGTPLEPFRARAVIVAIPVGVMKAATGGEGTLEIEPEIPDKQRALAKLEFGHVFKIVLRFRESFWAEDTFIEERLAEKRSEVEPLNFIHAREASVPTWWTALPAQASLLTGWAGGPKAEALLNESEITRVDRSLATLAEILKVPRRLVDDLLDCWSMHDWRADPFSRGAYTYVGVGGVAAQKALAGPVQSTLFFAGEATDPEQTATVAGAIASGRRAARQLISVVES